MLEYITNEFQSLVTWSSSYLLPIDKMSSFQERGKYHKMHVFLFLRVCVYHKSLLSHLPERNCLIACWDCYQREIWLTFRLCVVQCLNILIAFVHFHQYLCVCVSFSLNLLSFCWLCQLQHLLGLVALFISISCLILLREIAQGLSVRLLQYSCHTQA